jgi:hypothetical protein
LCRAAILFESSLFVEQFLGLQKFGKMIIELVILEMQVTNVLGFLGIKFETQLRLPALQTR